jgi:NAD(P)-dependent dehydrogenase (short-subunit alcohol dehydrogenase family)
MKVDLHNRIAVVTGAAGPIGRSTAMALAEHGVVVAATDNRYPQLACDNIRRLGGRVQGYLADLSDSSAVEVMVSKIESELGPIDILVNCASVPCGFNRLPIHQFPDLDWERAIGIDLDGVFRCSRAIFAQMIQRQSGTIVNVVSTLGVVPARFHCAYAVANAGIVNLTRLHALEGGQYGIRVNGIAAGLIVEESSKAEFYNLDNKEKADSLLSHIPLGVPGETRDITAAVIFLASDDARNVTGQVLAVDGGWTVGFSRDW